MEIIMYDEARDITEEQLKEITKPLKLEKKPKW